MPICGFRIAEPMQFRLSVCIAEHISSSQADLLTLEELDRLCSALVACGVRGSA